MRDLEPSDGLPPSGGAVEHRETMRAQRPQVFHRPNRALGSMHDAVELLEIAAYLAFIGAVIIILNLANIL